MSCILQVRTVKKTSFLIQSWIILWYYCCTLLNFILFHKINKLHKAGYQDSSFNLLTNCLWRAYALSWLSNDLDIWLKYIYLSAQISGPADECIYPLALITLKIKYGTLESSIGSGPKIRWTPKNVLCPTSRCCIPTFPKKLIFWGKGSWFGK